MTRFFGTDGIRGIANQGIITAEFALKLGAAAGTMLHKLSGSFDTHKKVVIGKDTRLSGYLLEYALISGFISVGVDVLLVGPMPTPAVSMLTKSLRADLGVMISASHNAYQYNGIKIVDSNGEKLSLNLEQMIEDLLANYPSEVCFAASESLGKATRIDDAPGRYVEFAKNTFPKTKTLHGVKLVIDSANGAAYHIAKQIFWELGAEVIHIADTPDGFNINEKCGSTSPQNLISAVLEHGCHVGIALDGDADRVILCDEKGTIVDGDEILAVIATYLKSKNQLKSNTVVSTHMSNVGLEKYLNEQGIKLIRTDIGDKHVAREMLKHGYILGGEPSGHIILSEFAATGDGIIAALQVLASYIGSGRKPLSELCHRFARIPQTLYAIQYAPSLASNIDTIIDSIHMPKLDDESRLLIRRSGTEPVIRVMVESTNPNLANEVVQTLKDRLRTV